MTKLDGAVAAHAEANAHWNTLQRKAADARARADDLQVRIDAGDDTVSPGELPAAVQEAAHFSAVARGAESKLRELGTAVSVARAEQICDDFTAGLPPLGSAVYAALDGLTEALAEVERATTAYDGFVKDATTALDNAHPIDRIQRGPNRPFTVDNVRVQKCRADSQVCQVLLPALRRLGAPRFLLEALRDVAPAAPDLPTTGGQR
jgi:hypothetical protein